jgi:folylpolyglutamate synthase/dihydropteroate synthase
MHNWLGIFNTHVIWKIFKVKGYQNPFLPLSIVSIDLSLDRLRVLVSHLPPYTRRPTCHIAGTNGNGSVSTLLSTILQSSSPSLKVAMGRHKRTQKGRITVVEGRLDIHDVA